MTVEQGPAFKSRITTLGNETISWLKHFGFIAKDIFNYREPYRSEMWRDLPLVALGVVACVGVVMASRFSIEIKANAPQVPEKVDLSFEITGACTSSHFYRTGMQHLDVIIRKKSQQPLPWGVIITASGSGYELPITRKIEQNTRFPPEIPMHFENRLGRTPVDITIVKLVGEADVDRIGKLLAEKKFNACQ